MRFALVFVACLAVALGSPVPPSDNVPLDKEAVKKELIDFTKLLPTEKIADVILHYAENDPEVKHMIDYMGSDELRNNLAATEKTKEFRAFLDYVDNSGFDSYEYVNNINEGFGIDRIEKQGIEALGFTGGMKGLVKDYKAVIPFDEIEQLHHYKTLNSGIYALFINRMKDEEFNMRLRNWFITPSFLKMVKDAEKAGLDTLAMYEFMLAGFGIRDIWAHPPQKLINAIADLKR